MNFPFFIARRYLFSKKSTHVINVISSISVIGVAVATMALVIVLSVFNGFHDLVASLFTSFDPQLKVVPVEGKTAPSDDPILTQIRLLPEVDVATETVEDQALAIYQGKQAMVKIKGVEDNFSELSHITDILYGDGTYSLHAANLEYGILGIRLAQTMGIGAQWDGYLKIYAPKKEGQLDLSNPGEGFVADSLNSPGVLFSVRQSKYDKNYIVTSIAFARNLFGQQGMLSDLEIRLKEGSNLNAVKAEMQKIAGTKYKVLDRFEQQEDTFKIMSIEKLMAYIFLTFILVVACFNIIGSLSMLIIDKKNDVVTLRNLGANDKQITRVFLFEGRMIAVIGAVIGIGLGLLLCLLQQQYGFVRLGESEGSFIVDAYPVSVHYTDVAIIFVTVIAVGWLAVWYPVRALSKRLLS
ncbi:FtsX-like permease family protein [Segatella copri]|jgi:lipoprotein-releasing system permease protein|uniref:ABC transporter permease n=1 Tax=Segatella copri TaxID=165179 RepID=A0A6G1TWY6_9BACT|nr:FtsX-like permease family protein [Segatella copri]MBV3401216.1 FtsX-like permease family protein [Segatella copri]MBW0047940.1 FtsX-like permease family protein [Segatella copri]MCW4119339.1 FtsX-like permease family protein [Segatella copri]MQN79687.1 ABC transporter permease [Segatella copri]